MTPVDYRHRGTDPMIAELMEKVDRLDGKVEAVADGQRRSDRKLDNHMLEEQGQLQEIADNKTQLAEVHVKLDQLIDLASVWSDLKGFARVSKWAAALIVTIAGVWAAIISWPGR